MYIADIISYLKKYLPRLAILKGNSIEIKFNLFYVPNCYVKKNKTDNIKKQNPTIYYRVFLPHLNIFLKYNLTDKIYSNPINIWKIPH